MVALAQTIPDPQNENSECPPSLDRLLFALRTNKGQSLEVAAGRLSPTALWDYEHGKRVPPSKDILLEIAWNLRCSDEETALLLKSWDCSYDWMHKHSLCRCCPLMNKKRSKRSDLAYK
jgi:hypothetical protein